MNSKLLDPERNSIVISTGNILSIEKKGGCKPTEELIDGLKLTLQDADVKLDASGELNRNEKELKEKLAEHERENLSIGAKIFLKKNSTENLNQAVTSLLNILQTNCVDSAVLAYHPKPVSGANSRYGVLEWSSKNEKSIEELKELWTQLEQFSNEKKICQLGVSDLDEETLTELYKSSRIHPAIAQINLASCCVVPPALQEFCKKNYIQLLTHSDPDTIMDDNAWEELKVADYLLDWVVRYQVHVRCRGVLTVKGYIVGASRPSK